MANPIFHSISTRPGVVVVTTEAGSFSFPNPNDHPVAASVTDVRNLIEVATSRTNVLVTDAAARTIAAIAPGLAPLQPTFSDHFESDDPLRWIAFDGAHWPPLAGAGGKWARSFWYGWPTKGAGEDLACRQNTGNHEAQSYEDSGVTITPAGLVLTATRTPSRGLPWTSGCITQSRDLAQLYGYFEVTMTLPTAGKGFWPGFWLLAQSLAWPPEIDVMEAVSLDGYNAMNPVAYRGGVIGGAGVWASANPGVLNRFGVLWTKDTIVITLNGEQIGDAQPTPANTNIPMYMLVDMAVGAAGSWPGEPDASVNTSSVTVRSVKSWKLGSWGSTRFPPAT